MVRSLDAIWSGEARRWTIPESTRPRSRRPAAPAQPAAESPPLRRRPATGPVVVAATEDVWLRIYEPDGSDLYKGMLRAGERYQVPAGAAAPLDPDRPPQRAPDQRRSDPDPAARRARARDRRHQPETGRPARASAGRSPARLRAGARLPAADCRLSNNGCSGGGWHCCRSLRLNPGDRRAPIMLERFPGCFWGVSHAFSSSFPGPVGWDRRAPPPLSSRRGNRAASSRSNVGSRLSRSNCAPSSAGSSPTAMSSPRSAARRLPAPRRGSGDQPGRRPHLPRRRARGAARGLTGQAEANENRIRQIEEGMNGLRDSLGARLDVLERTPTEVPTATIVPPPAGRPAPRTRQCDDRPR
jgi:hypothetical protein